MAPWTSASQSSKTELPLIDRHRHSVVAQLKPAVPVDVPEDAAEVAVAVLVELTQSWELHGYRVSFRPKADIADRGA